MVSLSLSHATLNDVQDIAKLVDLALASDLVHQQLFVHPTDRRQWSEGLWRSMIESKDIYTLKVTDEDAGGRLVGISNWIKVDKADGSSVTESVLGNEVPAGMNIELANELKEKLEEAKVAALPEHAEYWDLTMLAVDGSYRRQGIGSMLIKWAVDRAGEAFLWLDATPQGVHLYKNFGFVQASEVLHFKGGGTKVCMIRKPTTA